MSGQELSIQVSADGQTPASRRMRWKAARQRARIKAFRLLAVFFGRITRFCLQHTRPTRVQEQKLRKAQHSWRALLSQFQTQEAMRGLLDCGVLGNDLPRLATVPSARRVLVLAAHQDDETVAAAGTLLLCRRAGATVQAVYVTDGATGFGTFTPRETARLRAAEAVSVWRELAGTEPVFMGYPNRSESLPQEAGERLSAVIERFDPECIFLPNFLEAPIDHRRVNDVLAMANEVRPIGPKVQIWGYQITTRLPGNVAVDITSVWRRKYRINRMWDVPNSNLNYAHLAMGRDIANSYYLKGRHVPKKTASHAELFLTFEAPAYLRLARTFTQLPEGDQPRRVGSMQRPDFLIIGMQKAGTYWLTALLDAHAEIRCFPSRPGHADGTGEAHLFDTLALLDRDYGRFRKSMRSKLEQHFADLIPDEPPADRGARDLLLDRIRRRFDEYCHWQRQEFGKRLVGEKTAETVHHPDLVERLYPGIRKVCVLRDPRDRTVSFHHHQIRKGRRPQGAAIGDAEVDEYVERVRMDYEGLLAMPDPCHVLTYEALSDDPHGTTAALLRSLDVAADDQTIERMVRQASFEHLARRPRGQADGHSHFRKGVAGGWRDELAPALARRIVEANNELTERVEARFGLDLSAYKAS